MTKKEYLRQLEEELILIDEDIADDIIEYYRSRFEDGKKFESKTVDEIIEELGTPKELSKRIYGSYGIREDLWSSARQEDVKTRRAVPVILFDFLVASWLIPLIAFIILAGFGSFVTFPIVIASIPGLGIWDSILVILLSIGTYSIIFLLLLGLTEVGIVITRSILIWNLKVLSPRNKTTSRLIKRFSLFQWMREMRLGRNIFINIAMIGISIISISFILLTNFSPDVFSAFASNTQLDSNVVRDMTAEIEAEEPYVVNIDVGDVDVKVVENLGTNLEVTHLYTLSDLFNVEVDLNANTIYISTDQDSVNEGILNDYFASIYISIPEGLEIDSIVVKALNGDVEMIDFESDVVDITNSEGDIYLYSMESESTDIISELGSITIIDGFYKYLNIGSTTSNILVTNTNNMLKDGSILKVTTFEGSVDLKNTYYKSIEVDTNAAPIYLVNDNDIYVIENLDLNSPEGEVIIDATYTE